MTLESRPGRNSQQNHGKHQQGEQEDPILPEPKQTERTKHLWQQKIMENRRSSSCWKNSTRRINSGGVGADSFNKINIFPSR